jgi:NAD+ synthetase
VPLVIVNDIGLQNEENNFYIHDGRSLVISAQGDVLEELPAFAESNSSIIFSEIGKKRAAKPIFDHDRDVEQLWEALLFSSKQFTMGSLVPASGGVDSSVVLALEAIAKGADQVIALTMPGPHTGRTLGLVQQLFSNLGVWHAEAPIGDAVKIAEAQMQALTFISSQHPGKSRSFTVDGQGLTHQNLQARERGNRAMTLAQMSGHGIINTNNKLEIAFGYGAIHGNWIGLWAPLGDVPKGRQFKDSPGRRPGVWDLARYINQRYGDLIPREIIEMKPTTELSDGVEQPFFFPYHDAMIDAWQSFRSAERELRDPEAFLETYLDGKLDSALGLTPGMIDSHFESASAFVGDLEDKWARFFRSNYKLSVMPPLLVTTHRAFGRDKRHSQGREPYTALYAELKEKVLQRSR